MKLIDLTGLKIRTFTVIERSSGGRNPRWKCVCDCGEIRDVVGAQLRRGTVWCKCQGVPADRKTMQGIWRNMLDRCENPRNINYKNYGGRGIKVCEEWQDFEAFYNHMSPRPQGLSVDRIDNDGNYEPSNCRWATQKEQMSNVRRNVVLTYKGKTMIASDWANCLGITREAFRRRVASGMTGDKLFTSGKVITTTRNRSRQKASSCKVYGHKIKRYREKQKISAAEVGKSADLSARRIYQIEAQEVADINRNIAKAIAHKLGRKLEEIAL